MHPPSLLLLFFFLPISLADLISHLPTASDSVHHAFPNGPTYSAKLGNGWPSFATESTHFSLVLVANAPTADCVAATSPVTLSQCVNYQSSARLAFDASSGLITDDAGNILCPDSTLTPSSFVFTSACSTDARFTYSSSKVFTHEPSSLCLAADSTSLTLSPDCDSQWSFYTTWNEPPGYENGWTTSGLTGNPATSYDPPRYQVNLDAASCKQYRMSLSDESGAVASSLTLTRSDGEVFPIVVPKVGRTSSPPPLP